MHSIATKMTAEVKVQLKLLDVFEDANDIVDMNGSIINILIKKLIV